MRPPQYAPAPGDLDLESGVRVTCDTGYLCLLRPLCSLLRPDVCNRQTDVRQHRRLMPPPRGRWHNKEPCVSVRVLLIHTQTKE